MKPTCIHCAALGKRKAARYPKGDRPLFCTLKHALRYATNRCMDANWCAKHSQWYWQEGCYDCAARKP